MSSFAYTATECSACDNDHYLLNAPYPQILIYFWGYFLQEKPKTNTCKSCRKEFDFWDTALSFLKQEPVLFRQSGARFFGAKECHFKVRLKPDECKKIIFSDQGVPQGARILYTVMTPSGDVQPIEVRSNELERPHYRSELILYGRVFKNKQDPKPSDISILISYLNRSKEDYALFNLLSAYENFLWDKFNEMILPASTVVEDTLNRVISDFLKTYDIKPDDNATKRRFYFNTLLPLVSQLGGSPEETFPELPEKVENLIKALWEKRNEMAHKGRLTDPLSFDKAAELMCSAIFGYRYLEFLEKFLTGDPPAHFIADELEKHTKYSGPKDID